MAIADVLLIPDYPLIEERVLREAEPPLSEAFEVAPGVQLAGIREDAAAAIIGKTGFRHGDQNVGAMYAFVRYDPPGERWDQDLQISKALYLSHFVHAHEGGFEFAARLETDDQRRPVKVDPFDVAPPFARAYPVVGIQRRWLTQYDAKTLRALVDAYDQVLPNLKTSRLGMAVSAYAEAPFVYHGRPRGQLIGTALEGLVSTSTQRAVKQFTTRIPALASEVGLPELGKDWADEVYKIRSKLAHGGSLFGSASEGDRDARQADFEKKLLQMDRLLRRIVRAGLIDKDFRDRLENLDTHHPVPGLGCPTCRIKDPNLLPAVCPVCQQTWQ
jgi:hypothetical protein